jgi:hypothetical protein
MIRSRCCNTSPLPSPTIPFLSSARTALIIGAYRGAELEQGHPLADYEQIMVNGLDTYQAGRLLAAAAGRDLPDLLVKPIAKETDGNPSLILEALLLLAQEGIDGLTG